MGGKQTNKQTKTFAKQLVKVEMGGKAGEESAFEELNFQGLLVTLQES